MSWRLWTLNFVVIAAGAKIKRNPWRRRHIVELDNDTYTTTSIAMTQLLQRPLSALVLISCALTAAAHGGGEHAQIVVAPDADWATRHMAGTLYNLTATNPYS